MVSILSWSLLSILLLTAPFFRLSQNTRCLQQIKLTMEQRLAEWSAQSAAETAAMSWETSVEQLKREEPEDSQAAISLLKIFTFMVPEDLPSLAFGATDSLPEPLQHLKGLAKKTDFVRIAKILLKYSLIGQDDSEGKMYIDFYIRRLVSRPKLLNDRQSVYRDAAFMLCKLFPGMPGGGGYSADQLSTCKVYFPQVQYHLDCARESLLEVCDYSAIAAVHAAR